MIRYLLMLIALFCLFGCGSSPAPPGRWDLPPRVIHVDIVVGKYNYATCIEAGGVWVSGDSKNWLNEIAGCIEPETEVKDGNVR